MNWIILVLGALSFVYAKRNILKNGERRLYEYLLQSYDPASRPVFNANSIVNVNFSIALHQIMDLVEKNQTLVTVVWIYEEWIDEMLVWDPQKYDGVTHTTLRCRDIWLPDLYIFNNADKGQGGFVNVNESRVLVKYDGHVQWGLPLIIKSSCAVDVKYFPFDNQHCSIRFGSWIYEDTQLNVRLKENGVDMQSYVTNSELDLLSAHLVRESQPYSIFDGSYPQISMLIHIRRRPLFYSYTVLAPTLVLCILALFSFLLPCDSGDKVGIGLTVFLSLYVLQLSIAENMPESNSLPLIGLFLTLVMTLNSISLVFATLVINIKKKGDRASCPCVPQFVLSLCRNYLAPLTFTRFLNYYDFYETCDEEIEQLFPEVITLPEPEIKIPRKTDSTVLLKNRKYAAARAKGKKPIGMKKLMFTEKRHKIPAPRDPKLEWYFVAEVVDKVLFILFLIAMTLTIAVSLVIVPYLHKDD